jgi:hypothetical protein
MGGGISIIGSIATSIALVGIVLDVIVGSANSGRQVHPISSKSSARSLQPRPAERSQSNDFDPGLFSALCHPL